MTPRSERILIVVVFTALVLAAEILFSMMPELRESPHELGEKLLLAAEQRDWIWAKTLLEAGADPNLTAITPPSDPGLIMGWLYAHGLPNPNWRAQIKVASKWWGPENMWNMGSSIWDRPCPLAQAIEQDNLAAIKLLLFYKAEITPRLVREAALSGNREMICLVEDTAHVPVRKRNISQVPFASGAEMARAEVVLGTVGAVPTRRLLWVSDHELLILREAPRRFVLINVKSGSETEMPELSKTWAAQEQFNPESFILSPDCRWLLGFGGTKEHPTWLATEVRGNGKEEWNLVSHPDGFAHPYAHFAEVAWQDNQHWVEFTTEYPDKITEVHVVRLRNLGDKEVPQTLMRFHTIPPVDYYYPEATALFLFPKPTEGLAYGEVRELPEGALLPIARVQLLPTECFIEESDVQLKAESYAGRFAKCLPSPDGKHQAWLNFFDESGARDILVTDADGKNARMVYESLYPNAARLYSGNAADAPESAGDPWLKSLSWTPQGDGLLFWRGDSGENGLGLLHLTPEALR